MVKEIQVGDPGQIILHHMNRQNLEYKTTSGLLPPPAQITDASQGMAQPGYKEAKSHRLGTAEARREVAGLLDASELLWDLDLLAQVFVR